MEKDIAQTNRRDFMHRFALRVFFLLVFIIAACLFAASVFWAVMEPIGAGAP